MRKDICHSRRMVRTERTRFFILLVDDAEDRIRFRVIIIMGNAQTHVSGLSIYISGRWNYKN